MKNKNLNLVLLCVLCVSAVNLFSACGTVAPKPVQSHSIAPAGNDWNGGIIGPVHDASGKFIGWEVSGWWFKRHDQRIAQYGDQLIPAQIDSQLGITLYGKNFLATSEAMDIDVQIARKIRNGDKPTPGWEKLLNKLLK